MCIYIYIYCIIESHACLYILEVECPNFKLFSGYVGSKLCCCVNDFTRRQRQPLVQQAQGGGGGGRGRDAPRNSPQPHRLRHNIYIYIYIYIYIRICVYMYA